MFSTAFTHFGTFGDADAQAFITAANITDATQKTAINTLVSDLKSNNLYTKINAFWPIVGGASASHKYNLVNPLDTDAAFRLTYNGTITHDANGMSGNALSSTYCDTHFAPNIVWGATGDGSIMMYTGTTSTGDKIDMGVYNDGQLSFTQYFQSVPALKGGMRNNYFENPGGNTSNVPGFHAQTSGASGTNVVAKLYVGATAVQVLSQAEGTMQPWPPTGGTSTNCTLTIMGQRAWPANSIGNNSDRRFQTVALFNSRLSDAEISTLKSLVDTFQTTLGRNV